MSVSFATVRYWLLGTWGRAAEWSWSLGLTAVVAVGVAVVVALAVLAWVRR